MCTITTGDRRLILLRRGGGRAGRRRPRQVPHDVPLLGHGARDGLGLAQGASSSELLPTVNSANAEMLIDSASRKLPKLPGSVVEN